MVLLLIGSCLFIQFCLWLKDVLVLVGPWMHLGWALAGPWLGLGVEYGPLWLGVYERRCEVRQTLSAEMSSKCPFDLQCSAKSRMNRPREGNVTAAISSVIKS